MFSGAKVMSGSGHLQTFRFLRFLRSRNSADGHVNYGTQLAVSFPINLAWENRDIIV